jgi:GxxExxY protein
MEAAARDELNELAKKVIGAVYEVSNELGAGFLEAVYERSLVKELALRGIKSRRQARVRVNYKGDPVGVYRTDVLVEEKLLVEIKCADGLSNKHLAQCLNYLKATDRTLCLLVNFQNPKVEWKRVVFNF